jgi:nucleoside-diphosphate-sugar epimerase
MTRSKPVVLITGSTGFIGRALARRLASDFTVVGLDSRAPSSLFPLEEFVPIDLTDGASVRGALVHVQSRHGDHLASVLHLAAYYNFSGEPSDLYEQVTVRGTQRLLEGLQGLAVDQFVFSSTMLVHAPTEPGKPISEQSPLEAKWDYPASKIRTEEIVRRYAGDRIPYVILRIAGVYDDGCHSVPIANQIQRILERKLIGRFFPGDTSHGQAFIHLDDLVDAFEAVVNARDRLDSVETFLLGEPETMSYDDLQRELSSLIHGEKWETERIPKTVAKAGAWIQDQVPGEEPFIKPWMIDLADDHYELDIARAAVRLGWVPKRRLRTSLSTMIEGLRRDPKAWYRENKLEAPAWLEPEAIAQPATA